MAKKNGKKLLRLKLVKVLQVIVGDGSRGGVTSFLDSYYKRFITREVHFDYLYCKKAPTTFLDEKTYSFSIFDLQIVSEDSRFLDYIKLYKRIKTIQREGQYDVIHINTGNIFIQACVILASDNNRIIISHSHSSGSINSNKRLIKEMIKKITANSCRRFIVKRASYLFACSDKAGVYLFGERGIVNSKFRFVKNAIDLNMFNYSEITRKQFRNQNKIDKSTVVVGHVGRFVPVKNHVFLLETFAKYLMINSNSVLWLVGDGELKSKVMEKARELQIENKVVFWGERKDVHILMQAMDVMVFPSIFEGLALSIIEAQAVGLSIVASDSLSMEHNVTDLISFVSLDCSPNDWAREIHRRTINVKRNDMTSELRAAGYDIDIEAKKLERFYLNKCNISNLASGEQT